MIKNLKRISLYFVLTIVSLLLLIQIPSINTRLAQSLLNIVLPTGMQAKITPLKGEFPFWILIDSIEVSDKDGVWLEIENLDFEWAAANLFFGKIDIEKIGADRLTLIRVPTIKTEKGRGDPFIPPIVIEDYYINELQISPWYSGSIKLHGDAYLKNTNNATASLYLETIDQLEHGDADLLELKISKDSQKIKIFAAAKDSLARFQTIAPEFTDEIKDGDYELNVDLEIDSKGTNINGLVSGAINNFESFDSDANRIIGNNLDFNMDIHKDSTGNYIVGNGEVTSSNHTQMDWDLTYALKTKEYDSKLTLNIPKIEELFPANLEGRLTLIAFAKGILDFRHELKWEMTGLSLSGQKLQNFTGDVFLENHLGQANIKINFPKFQSAIKGAFKLKEEILDFTSLSIKGTQHDIEGNLSLHLINKKIGSADLAVNISDLNPLADLLQTVSLSGSVVGTYHHNSDQINAAFKAKNLVYNSLFFEEAETTVDYKDRKNYKLSALASQGTFNDVKLKSIDFVSECQKGKGTFSNHMLTSDVEWVASGSINTTVKDIIDVVVKQATLIYEKKQYFSLDKSLAIKILPHQFKISSNRIHLGEGVAKFSDLIFGDKISGNLILQNIPANTFSIFSDDHEFAGVIKGNVEVSGNYKEPLIAGKIILSDFGVADNSRKTRKKISSLLDFHFKDNHWLIKLDYADSEESKFVVESSISSSQLIPDKFAHITTKMKGNLHLSILNGFIWWGDRIKGNLNVNLTSVIGSNKASHKGHLTLQGGEYENAEFGTVLKQINLNMILNESQIKITELAATDIYKGMLTGKGVIHLNGFENIRPDISLTFQDLLLVNNDIVAANGTGKLFIKSLSYKAFVLGGEITANYVDIFLDDTVSKVKNITLTDVIENSTIRKKRRKTKLSKPSSSLFDLKVHIPEKLYVQGRGIKSMWKGDLLVTGPLNEPDVKGELVVKRGKVELIGKHLEIKRKSKIWFEKKDHELVPAVDITLEKTVQDVDAMIKVSGLVTDPKIDFISIPPLAQEEVVSLILFGKPLSSVSSAQSLQLATAIASIKAGNNKMNIIDQFQQAFGLDELTFQGAADEGDENGQHQSANYSVRVGKQLNDKIYFGVDQGLGEEGQTKAIVDIDITKNTKVDIEVGPEDRSVGYFWEKRY